MRSRRLAENATWQTSPQQKYRCDHLWNRVTSVLLRHPTALCTPTLAVQQPIDNDFQYQDLMCSTNTERDHLASYLCCVLFDSNLSGGGLHSVVCQDTMEPMFDKLQMAAFFIPISQVTDRLALLLTKGIPCKCYTRQTKKKRGIGMDEEEDSQTKELTKLKKKLASAKSPQLKKFITKEIHDIYHTQRTLYHWIACTLLGNYRHALPSSRPNRRSCRQFIYDEFVSSPVGGLARDLVKYCKSLVYFAVREYTVYALHELPGFRKQIHKSLFDVEHYERVVLDACNSFRVLLTSIQDWTNTQMIFGRIEQHFVSYRKNLQQFQRPFDSIFKDLTRVRTTIPLVPLNGHRQLIKSNNVDLTMGYTNDDQNSDDDEETEGFNPLEKQYTIRHLRAFATRDAIKKKNTMRKETSLNPFDYMPHDHVRFMHDVIHHHVIQSISTTLGYCLVDTLFWFMQPCIVGACLGIQYEVCERVLKLLSLLHQRVFSSGEGVTKRIYSETQKKSQIKNLAESEPYAYNVIQCCIDTIVRVSKFAVVGWLPSHYRHNQTRALQASYPELTGGIHDLATCLIYCKYCGKIDTKIRSFNDPESTSVPPNLSSDERSSSTSSASTMEVMPRLDESSYKSMFINLNAMASGRGGDSLRCYHKRRGVKEGCDENDLCRVSLLGRVIKLSNNALATLCPQCSFPMEYDPQQSAVTRKGTVCSFCTRELDQKRYTTKWAIMMELGFKPGQRSCRCSACDEPLTKSSSIFYYPFGLFLCSKCSIRQVVTDVRLYMANGEAAPGREGCLKLIVETIRQRKWERERSKVKQYRCYGYKTSKQWLNQVIERVTLLEDS